MLVRVDGVGQRAQAAIPNRAVGERKIHPRAQRLNAPLGNRIMARLHQMRVDRDGQAFLAHTLILL